MSEYDNSGAISKNLRKTKDTHPEYSGKCQIQGIKYWISGWVKEKKDGSGGFLSLAFKPMEEQDALAAAARTTRQAATEEILPF